MDPFRYRKAYEAMLHASQLLEVRLNDGHAAASQNPTDEDVGSPRPILEEEDDDTMEWTPTEAVTPPVGCGPPPTTSQNMRHLLPDGGQGEYRIEEKGSNSVLLHKLQEGIIMDECIDKLVQDLPEVLSYDGSTAFTPSTIEVPKG